MAVLKIVCGPDPIFKKSAELVSVFDDGIRKNLKDMADTLYYHKALGIGANMVGILQQLVVVDLQQDGEKLLYKMVNPKITFSSEQTDFFMEGSISFPGIQAKIERPKYIEVEYYTEGGEQKYLKADGMLARVIQHEIDYLNGKVFLDYLSPTKRKLLLLKIRK